MIRITKPYVVSDGETSRLICKIYCDDEEKEIYFNVDKEFGKYLCFERADAFLIALFYFAMRNGHDIICESPVSEDLYYQITEYLIPVLLEKSKCKLKNINIQCELAENIQNIGAVGTGLTCGVDSFHAIFNNLNNKCKSRKLTHLIIMSLADSYKKDGKYELITNDIYSKAQIVSEKLNLPLIKVKSNIRELFPIPPMHTLIRLFGVYALQKLFGVYYFASGFPIWTFNIEDSITIDSARYDLLLCKCLTTKNLFVYSEGGQKTRIDKIKFISDYEVAKQNLHVCVKEASNCGKCKKCIRTMCALDSINKLEQYSSVFDVNYYYNNLDFYFNEIMKMYNDGDLFIYEFIYDLAEKYKNNSVFSNYKVNDKKNDICNFCYRKSDYNSVKNNT